MSTVNPRQYDTIQRRKESLRTHIDNNDGPGIDAHEVRALALAYIMPFGQITVAQTIDNSDELGNKHQMEEFLFQVVRQETYIEVEHERRRPERVHISHVTTSKHQPPSEAGIGNLLFDNTTAWLGDESLMIGYDYGRKTVFAPLDDKEQSWGRLAVAEKLLALPDNPIYIPN